MKGATKSRDMDLRDIAMVEMGMYRELNVGKWQGRDLKFGEVDRGVKDDLSPSLDAIKEPSIRRLVNKIIHGLIEDHMLCILDFFSLNVVVKDIVHGGCVAKENTGACHRIGFLWTTRLSRKSIELAFSG